MAKKIDVKEVGMTTLLGTSVVVLTPIVSNLFASIPFMATDVFGIVTVGSAIGAGISAFGAGFVIDKYLR